MEAFAKAFVCRDRNKKFTRVIEPSESQTCESAPSVPHSAKLSAEHITSEWMGEMFPGRKDFKSTDHLGNERSWTAPGLDIKAKVVCEACNTGWMSEIEDKHAKPTMSPLMRGEINAMFGKEQARSLALFAFKSAVVVDYAQRHRDPFFSRRQRHAFREHLFIPQAVTMWMTPYIPHIRKRRFDYRVGFYKGELTPGYQLQLYICTFGLAALAFQVVAHKQMLFSDFVPLPGFDDLAVPFWPALQPGYIWPGPNFIRSFQQFKAFHERWDAVAPA